MNDLNQEVKDFVKNSAMAENMLNMESNKLHAYLKEIDPTSANKIHPNNKRKIMR